MFLDTSMSKVFVYADSLGPGGRPADGKRKRKGGSRRVLLSEGQAEAINVASETERAEAINESDTEQLPGLSFSEITNLLDRFISGVAVKKPPIK